MITKWKVANFKSIREGTPELELGPLTIFAGANSSGKSTLIQSILLVAQTLAHKVGSRSVVLNGALTSLGQFDDLKSNDGESDQITITCTCKPLAHTDGTAAAMRFTPSGIRYYTQRSNQLKEITCEISFDADPSSSERDLFQIQPRLFATQLSCVTRDEDNVDQKAGITIRHSNKSISEIVGSDGAGELNDKLRASLAYAVELDDGSMEEVKDDFRSARPAGCVLQHFLPDKVVYSIDVIEEDASAISISLQEDARRGVGLRRVMGRDILLPEQVIAVLRDVLKDAIDVDLVFKDKSQQESLFGSEFEVLTFRAWYERLYDLPREERFKVLQALRGCDDLFDRILESMRLSAGQTRGIHEFVTLRPPRLLAESALYLDKFFASSLKYLGPLRDAPKPLYPLAPAADPNDVGLRGEHTAAILDLHKNKKIRYIPTINFESPLVDKKLVTRTLESAVIDWLQYLGVANSVASRDKGKLGHELKVSLFNSSCSHDLTHVGVGVSQVLPILVMCLLADTDTTLVFEQPELHLHPKVQTLLGDFFLSMALCKKQCIVETHSEYLIDRLRYRIAAASTEMELNGQIKIYFVEKPGEGSSFREVNINEYGAISDWPEGFFDQSQREAEAILTAALAKKRAKKDKD